MNKTLRCLHRLSPVALYLFVASACASAGTLAGDTIGLDWLYPNISTIAFDYGTVTVPGTFFDVLGLFDVVVGDTTITSTNLTTTGFADTSFNGFVITDLSNSPITSVTVDSSSTWPVTSLAFTSNQIWVNFAGHPLPAGSTLQLDITGARSGSAIPEPGTWLLLGSSLVGLASWRKLRRR
jgi:hypothetical protein